MNILSAFVVVLLVMLVAVFLIPGEKKNAIRWTMAAGSMVILGLAGYLVWDFLAQREAGATDKFLFADSTVWYEGVINISYSVGVD
ncbi:MAG: NADH-quinone oxidoreductase subunit M, partial [Paludibacteraceae bacterium]|nr:NADH-quinone oxidoreductase subunit M [Paludibacteraceae bacterium]